jgi:hypothetical protein
VLANSGDELALSQVSLICLGHLLPQAGEGNPKQRARLDPLSRWRERVRVREACRWCSLLANSGDELALSQVSLICLRHLLPQAGEEKTISLG